jgi:hypothetical protein
VVKLSLDLTSSELVTAGYVRVLVSTESDRVKSSAGSDMLIVVDAASQLTCAPCVMPSHWAPAETSEYLDSSDPSQVLSLPLPHYAGQFRVALVRYVPEEHGSVAFVLALGEPFSVACVNAPVTGTAWWPQHVSNAMKTGVTPGRRGVSAAMDSASLEALGVSWTAERLSHINALSIRVRLSGPVLRLLNRLLVWVAQQDVWLEFDVCGGHGRCVQTVLVRLRLSADALPLPDSHCVGTVDHSQRWLAVRLQMPPLPASGPDTSVQPEDTCRSLACGFCGHELLRPDLVLSSSKQLPSGLFDHVRIFSIYCM